MRFLILLIVAFAAAISPSTAAAADWGDLKMRFVYDGEPPQTKFLKTGRNSEILDKSLVVNQRDRGIKNVCVWLLYGGDDPLPVHPDYETTATGKVTMKIAAGNFVPHIGIVRTTQTLVISNADSVGYDVNAHFSNNGAFSVLLKTGESFDRKLEYPEHHPMPLSASIQPLWGYVLIGNNPYAGLSDDHGNLTMANVPAGRWTFVFWHEKSDYLKKVIYNEGKYGLPRGQTTLTIKPGNTDLGEIKLLPEQFRK